MERYRVNYGLLIGLVVGVVAIGGGVFALYKIQQSRNASSFLTQADEAAAEGDLRAERGFLARYVNLRRDDMDAWERLTRTRLAISELGDAEPSEQRDGYNALEQFIQMDPKHDDLRRKLVDLLMKGRRFKDALSHIEYLLNSDPKNGELQAMRLQCIASAGQTPKAIEVGYKLVGYNTGTGEFDAEKATTPDEPKVYQLLALAIRGNRGDPELADRMMEELIENAPESSDAYLARAQYLAGLERRDEAIADVDKALELNSKNVDALLLKAQIVIGTPTEDPQEQEAVYDQAYALLEQAAAEDAADIRVYQYLAKLEAQRGKPEEAIKHYQRGIKATEDAAQMLLTFYMANAQVNQRDFEGVERSIQRLEEMQIRPEFVQYLKAKLQFANDEWFQASQELLRLRPSLSGQLDIFIELNVTLGLCFERLGQYERALEAYGQILARSPSHEFALAQKRRIEQILNPRSEVATSQTGINRMIGLELLKPKDEQNWAPVFAEIDSYAAQPLMPPGVANLLRAEVYVRLKDYRKAEKEVMTVLRDHPDDLRVWRAALRVIANDPEKGPAEALKKMEGVLTKFGDTPRLRLDKADFLIQLGDDQLTDQLLALADGVGDWDRNDEVQLWKGLAARFQQLGDGESRQQALEKVAALSPNELPTLLELFQSAIESNDQQRVAAAQADILKLVGSKDNATYQFTEANRLLWKYASGSADRSELDKADKLIERALLKRPDWHKLYQLQALVALARGDKPAALAAFEESISRGPSDGRPLLMHVSLLLEQQRYNDALKVLEQLSEGVRQRLLGRSYAEILFNTGDIDASLNSAEEVANLGPEDGGTQLWYGRFLLRASTTPQLSEERRQQCREQAEAALAKAVEVAPGSAEAWLAYMGLLVDLRDLPRAEQTLREAMLALPEDQQQGLVARGSEWLGRWFDAEASYRRLHEKHPEDLQAARSLAAFYLGPRYPKDDKEQKATPIINGMLRAAADDKELASNPNVFWARRTAAGILADSSDYQKLLKAENLLASNVVDGRLAEEDKLLMARILGDRPEPTSRVKAIRLLEEIQQQHVLSLADDMRLGQLYYRTDDWDACRSQMIETIARNPDAAAPRVAYINMLLDRDGGGDVTDASRQLSRLQQIAPQAPTTLQLVVRVANKLGKQKEALQAISRLVPRDLSKASVATLVSLAQLFTELGDLDRAESLFRAAAKREPSATLYLADFIGTKRDVGQAFEMLDNAPNNLPLQLITRTALGIVNERRDEIGDAYDEQIGKWLEKGIREDPLLVALQLQLAELRDLQERQDESVEIYRDLLKRDDLVGTARAVVLNNLGYVLGLTADDQQGAEEAMGYVAEAIDILGPQADILDTRAVVHTALKQYSAAVSDLELSLTDNPTASKYFHKARAHMLAGEVKKASDAWRQATERGLSRETIAKAEREHFDQLKQQINSLSQSAAN